MNRAAHAERSPNKMKVIAYYPESEHIVQYYRNSAYASEGDRCVPIEDLVLSTTSTDQIVVVGREANTHDADIDHIRTIRKIRGVHEGHELSLVCFDWHHDIDNEIPATELTPGSWVYYGLENHLFGNAYILGANAKIGSEVDPSTGKVVDEDSMVLRMLHRMRLFTGVPDKVSLRYDPHYKQSLEDNPSIRSVRVSSDETFVELSFKGWRETQFKDLYKRSVVSIDVDVLKSSEIRSDVPQGVWTVDNMLEAIQLVKSKTDVVGWMICGADVRAGRKADERSLGTMARIISMCDSEV